MTGLMMWKSQHFEEPYTDQRHSPAKSLHIGRTTGNLRVVQSVNYEGV